MSNPKVYIGSVTWRTEEVGHAQSMRLFQRLLDREGIEFHDATVVGDALVSRARSIAASAFLRSDADVLISIDSDIWFTPESALDLCRKAMDYGIIGALYMTRSLQTQPAIMLPNEKPIVFAAGQEPVEAQFLSTGFTAVRRDVFETLSRTLPHCHQGWNDRGVDTSFWPFYMPFVIPWEGEGHIYLSEDWAFCQRAKDAGFKLWLDPSIRLGHIGSQMYTLEDLLRPEKPLPQPLQMRRSPDGHLLTEFIKQIAPEIQTLPRDVAEHLGIDTADALRVRMAQGTQELARLWDERNGESPDAFYARADVGRAYILDLAAWHIKPKVADILTANLGPLRGKGRRILDYGSGIGTAALICSDGNNVSCIEPNQELRAFAEWRAQRLGRSIVHKQTPPRGSYDIAICWDVLEHVPNPMSTARVVAAALKPGGLLFADSDFTDEGEHPMHYLNPDDPHGVKYWEKLGFKRLDKLWWQKAVTHGTTV